VRNSGRYVWEVENKDLWKVHIRAKALDKAGNGSEHVYEKAVVIDLEKPAATIENVQGSGGPPSAERDSHRPPAPAPAGPAAPVVPSAPMSPPTGGQLPVPSLPGAIPDPGKG
jgi:hypothetical protein